MSSLPYSKATTPTPKSYDVQFKSTPSIPALKRRLSMVAQTQDTPHYTTHHTLQIQSIIPLLESRINSLIEGLNKFTATPQQAQAVIEADAKLSTALEELIEHQNAGKIIEDLKKVSMQLDNQLNEVLVNLSENRRELQSSLNIINNEDDSANNTLIPANDLLNYATKISKFTHAPPGYKPEVANEHANFPWPTEDGLRRGVLALSSLEAEKEEESFKTKQQPIENNTITTTTTISPSTTSISPPQITNLRQRRSSIVSYGEAPIITNPSASSPNPQQSHSPTAATNTGALDLDLFDPDDDEEDDDE